MAQQFGDQESRGCQSDSECHLRSKVTATFPQQIRCHRISFKYLTNGISVAYSADKLATIHRFLRGIRFESPSDVYKIGLL